MQGWLAPLLGTSVGLALVAGMAMFVVPDRMAGDIVPLVRQIIAAMSAPRPQAAPPPAASSAPGPVAAARPAPSVQPRAPRIAEPPPPQEDEIAPAPGGLAGLLRPPPPGWSTGTGFFVNAGGTILTAAHVVTGCRNVRVLSAQIRPDNARVVAIDAENDVAVLDVAGLSAPAWLPVAPVARDARHLFVLGFPQGSLPDVPNETWTGLANAEFPRDARLVIDPRDLVWLRHQVIGPGYSGGPVIDPNTGRVVGMIRAIFNSDRNKSLYGVSLQDMAIGPGFAPMMAMMSRWSMREGVVPTGISGERAVERARKATVRVVCTK